MTAMNHKGTQLLKTEHLTLRRFTEDDAEPMFRNWASDSEVTKFLTWPAHPCTDVSRAALGDWLKSYSDNKYYQWAIVPDDNNNEPVGYIYACIRIFA